MHLNIFNMNYDKEIGRCYDLRPLNFGTDNEYSLTTKGIFLVLVSTPRFSDGRNQISGK